MKRHTDYNQSLRGKYRELKRQARRKSRAMTITFEQFSKISQKPCTYCKGTFDKDTTGHGLDRKDPKGGYNPRNVLRACWFCNCIRGASLTVNETRKVIALIKKMRKLG